MRKVALEHESQLYNGTIQNISAQGAMIEGLWNVPEETVLHITLSETHTITAITRWSDGERMGVEFSEPLQRGADGTFTLINSAGPGQGSVGFVRNS